MAELERLTTRINIEMTGDTKRYLVSAKQGDKATRYIVAKLLNNGMEYTIPTDARVAFNVEKPDGKHIYNTCSYSGSEVTVELTNQTLAVAGTAYCDIEVRTSDNTQLITSASFTIEIEKSIRNDDAILSSNEFTELEDRIGDMEDMKKELSTEFTQAESRENIESGEKLSTILGKVKKYFADLKNVAFSGNYNDLTNKPNIPAAVRVKGSAESSYRTGDVNITKANIGLGNVDNTADANKNVAYAASAGSATKATQDGSGNVIADTYAKKSDLPSGSGGTSSSGNYVSIPSAYPTKSIGDLYTPIYVQGGSALQCQNTFVHLKNIFTGSFSAGGSYSLIADAFGLVDSLEFTVNGSFKAVLLRIVGYHSYKTDVDPFVTDVILSYKRTSGGTATACQSRCLALGFLYQCNLDIKADVGQCTASNVACYIKKSNGGSELTNITNVYVIECNNY